MNRLKNSWLLLLAMAAVGLNSCSDDYVTPEFQPKSYAVYSNSFVNGDLSIGLQLGDMFAIKNLSQGFLTHQFSLLQEGVPYADLDGNDWVPAENVHFIQPVDGYLPQASDEDFSPYYNPNVGSINNEESLVALFDNPGRYKLNVYQTFDEQISYCLKDKKDPVSGTAYMHRLHSIPMADGNEYVSMNAEIIIFESLTGAAIAYTDDTYTTERDLLAEQNETKDTTVNAFTVTVKKGDSIFFAEDGGDYEYNSSTECDWYADYAGADMPADEPQVDITYTKKAELGNNIYTRSKAQFQFNDLGYFKVYINQVRESEYSSEAKDVAILGTVLIHVVE